MLILVHRHPRSHRNSIHDASWMHSKLPILPFAAPAKGMLLSDPIVLTAIASLCGFHLARRHLLTYHGAQARHQTWAHDCRSAHVWQVEVGKSASSLNHRMRSFAGGSLDRPTLMLPVGKTTRLGALTTKHLNFPYQDRLQGANFVTQLLTLAPSQPGLPFGITNGRQARMPANAGTYGHAAVSLHSWSPKSSTLSMAVFYGGAPVALLQ